MRVFNTCHDVIARSVSQRLEHKLNVRQNLQRKRLRKARLCWANKELSVTSLRDYSWHPGSLRFFYPVFVIRTISIACLTIIKFKLVTCVQNWHLQYHMIDSHNTKILREPWVSTDRMQNSNYTVHVPCVWYTFVWRHCWLVCEWTHCLTRASSRAWSPRDCVAAADHLST